MGTVSDEDKDGFINLNVRVHRDDILDAAGFDNGNKVDWAVAKKTLTKELFKEIAQKMADNEPFSGGDMFSDACRDAYDAVTEPE